MEQNRNRSTWKQWLREATDSLRMHPDCDLIQQELMDHLEDKAADLQRIFPALSADEAEEMALAQMGDAKEIDQALAQSVSKFWGGAYWLAYGLLQLTKMMMILVLPIYLWAMVFPLAFPWWPF